MVFVLLYSCLFLIAFNSIEGNESPIFQDDLNNRVISENTKVGTVIGTLSGTDPDGSVVYYGIEDSDVLSVDKKTGNVTLIKPLDREENDTIRLTVTLEDEVNGDSNDVQNNVVKLPITIIVADENDNPPFFHPFPSEIVVNESVAVNSVIFDNIIAEDTDLIGVPIEVSCHSDEADTCEKFEIRNLNSSEKYYEGGLVLKQPLNFTEKQFYALSLVATDGEFSTKAELHIRVIDVQNEPPVFENKLSAIVAEDAPLNNLVMTVKAVDGDYENKRSIFYDLIENPMGYFSLDGMSGELRVIKPLDREAVIETNGHLSLIVRARELSEDGIFSNEESATSFANISITISDTNDEPPRFNAPEYRVVIPENMVHGSILPIVPNITVTDSDSGNNSVFSLRLEDVSNAFLVEPTSAVGNVSVLIRLKSTSTLDFENRNQRRFVILIFAEESPTKLHSDSTARIIVDLADVNDNSPVFDESAYSASIGEATLPGSLVTTITAEDADSGIFGTEGIIYQLRGKGSDLFNVDHKTGVVTVALCASPGTAPCLDIETQAEYNLTFRATDEEGKGHFAEVPLKIILGDANDNIPIFEKTEYYASIKEGSDEFEPFTNDSNLKTFAVRAHDADPNSNVEYYINDESILQLFNIDKYSGILSLADGAKISRATLGDFVTFEVEAKDGLHSAVAMLNVTILDVNDNQPIFEKSVYEATIPEDLRVGENVIFVRASDVDSGVNARLSYYLEGGEGSDDFNIDATTGVIKVACKLNYDRRKMYEIVAVATDGGTPTLNGSAVVRIAIEDVNDKPPYFAPGNQNTEVLENAEVGSPVYKMVVSDADASSADALKFEIEQEGIRAKDKNGLSVVAADLNKYFEIDRDTGMVSVASILNRSAVAEVTYVITAKDTSAKYNQIGQGTLRITILHVNEPPMFLPPWTAEYPYYHLRISEDLPVGSVVATYTAVDNDLMVGGKNLIAPNGGISRYEITSQMEYFEVDEKNGTVKLKKNIDYETMAKTNFTLAAYDMGRLSAKATILVEVINVNDETPRFEKAEYTASLMENAHRGAFIVRVLALDRDAGVFGKVKYSLSDNNKGYFMIHEDIGDIWVNNSVAMDREKNDHFLVNVIASDSGGLKSEAIVKVMLTDVNDNQPVFTKHEYNEVIPETISFSPPEPVLQLHADDKDLEPVELHYSIVSGNDDGLFALDPDTGFLYPGKSLIGRGGSKYFLMVEASDGIFMDTTHIYINITDVNQYKPKFVVPAVENATVVISENLEENHLVLKVFAEDGDVGENGRISYHFKIDQNKTAQKLGPFTLDESSGDLRTSTSLDREVRSSYNLTILVRDHGSNISFESSRLITIVVEDVDDNIASFGPSKKIIEYTFHALENMENVFVGKVEATDADEGENAKIYYEIIEGNDFGLFQIREDGRIYVNGSLDREQLKSHELYVKASSKEDDDDNGILNLMDSSVAKVYIYVDDQNDNAPKFERPVYYAGVNCMTHAGSTVISVPAFDPDEGSQIRYEIGASYLYRSGANHSSGSIVPSPFLVDEFGRISIATAVTEYNQDRFEILLIAKETAQPYRETTTTLNVWIYELQQLVRVIISRPQSEVAKLSGKVAANLSSSEDGIRVVVDETRPHVDSMGQIRDAWSDLYVHLLDVGASNGGMVLSVAAALKLMDDRYDHLKKYYDDYAVENVLPAYTDDSEQPFETEIAALVASLVVLVVGCIGAACVFCCFRKWTNNDVNEPGGVGGGAQAKCSDALICKQPMIDDLSTTENPLWIEQKLKLYEEQELTMQVFCEPAAIRKSSDQLCAVDNTYATIQHPGRRNSCNTLLSLGAGDYATLGGSVLPLDRATSDQQQIVEAAFGFLGCTFQVPDVPPSTSDLIRARSELRVNKDGHPEFVSELM